MLLNNFGRLKLALIMALSWVSMAVNCDLRNCEEKTVICPALDFNYRPVTDFEFEEKIIFKSDANREIKFTVWNTFNDPYYKAFCYNAGNGGCECNSCYTQNFISTTAPDEAESHTIKDENGEVISSAVQFECYLRQDNPRVSTTIDADIFLFHFYGSVRLQPFRESSDITWLGDFIMGDSTYKNVIQIDVDTSTSSYSDQRLKPQVSVVYFSQFEGVVGFYDLIYNDLFYRQN